MAYPTLPANFTPTAASLAKANSIYNLFGNPQVSQQSATLRPVSRPAVKAAATVATPTPTPAPSNNSGRGDSRDPHINPSTGFYDDNYFAANNPSGGDSGGVDTAALDAAYNGIFSVLDAASTNATSNSTLDLQSLDAMKQQQLTAAQRNQDLATGVYDTQEQKSQGTYRSAYEDAVRNYQALQQNRVSRFGGGSSAGLAANDIANQEFYRQQGKLGTSLQDAMTSITQARSKTMNDFLTYQDEIEMESANATRSIKKQLSDQLQQIGLTKAGYEADKTQRKIAALETARQQVAAISAQKANLVQQSQIWFQQQDYLLKNKMIPQFSGYQAPSVSAGASSLTAGNTALPIPKSQAIGDITRVPNTNYGKDELGQLINLQ